MPRKHLIVYILSAATALAGAFLFIRNSYGQTLSFSQSEEGFEDATEPETWIHPRLRGLENWQRPEGPWKVALQVGHWFAEQAPDEQENLRKNSGATAAGYAERDVNLDIAERTKLLLEAEGIVVDLLPVTIPPNYWADVFVSIHADGNANSAISGYKIAAPRRDITGKAESLVTLLQEEYEKATSLVRDPNITSNMRGYYAFNWRRYDHSIHPMTVAAIVETGFISSPADRNIIVKNPDKAAQGIANAIFRFLEIGEGEGLQERPESITVVD